MKTIKIKILAVAFLLSCLPGCSGLRYSEISPDAADFHPARVLVLPADVTAFPEAKGVVEALFTEELLERKWFTVVSGGKKIDEQLQKNEIFRKTVSEYLAKKAKLNFSDPQLTNRIAELTGADAFLLPRVDSWIYTVEEDKKLARVSLSVTMVATGTGRILWNASHGRKSDYLIVKPALPDVAKGLVREMTGRMPH